MSSLMTVIIASTLHLMVSIVSRRCDLHKFPWNGCEVRPNINLVCDEATNTCRCFVQHFQLARARLHID